MTFHSNHGFSFSLPNKSGTELLPDGGVILASSVPAHTLVRRKDLAVKFPHMQRRLFDPQLYMAGLDPNQSANTCARLASYSWFGVHAQHNYSSGQQSQSQWMAYMRTKISALWPRNLMTDPIQVSQVVGDCVDFQIRLGCSAIILPSPLTSDPTTNYEIELLWLDSGLDYIRRQQVTLPVFATIALADICVSYIDPLENNLLDMILDAVSARKVDGVYIVLEQGREPGETKHSSNTRALQSILHLVHVFANDAKRQVTVNFLGQFGIACRGIGAKSWASDWYKASYRLRLADKIAGGRAFPTYWSYKAVLDVHLDKDFDVLSRNGIIGKIADRTDASIGLLMAASAGRSCALVPAWKYGSGNVTAAREHFLRSCIQAEGLLEGIDEDKRLDYVEDWLQEAAQLASVIETTLGSTRKTNTLHVQSWLDAFRRYRADHNV